VSAADSTSKSQFGWIETTTHTQTPEAPGQAREDRYSTRLKYVDRSGADPVPKPGEHQYGESHAEVHAEYTNTRPRLFTEDEKRYGEDVEHPFDPDRGVVGGGQGLLFHPGEVEGPVLGSLASTTKGRFASARGVGMMANLMERRSGGREMTGDSNLSAQSAPLVSKLTGKEAAVTNDIQFRPDPMKVSLPGPHLPTHISKELPGGALETTTHRWMGDEEATAGGAKLRDRMKAMRVNPMGEMPKGMKPSEPGEQQELFPEPHGHRGTTTFGTYQREKGLVQASAARRMARLSVADDEGD
jgi:hypothetical protein